MTDPAMNALIQRHGERVLALLQRQLGSRQDAEDAFQETWCAIWRALPRLRPDVDPWPFIRTAALRKAVDLVRERDRARVGIDRAEPLIETRETPELNLDALPPMERESITLFFWEGRSVREIAKRLNVPEATVKTWMFRARARLRAQLEPHERKDVT